MINGTRGSLGSPTLLLGARGSRPPFGTPIKGAELRMVGSDLPGQLEVALGPGGKAKGLEVLSQADVAVDIPRGQPDSRLQGFHDGAEVPALLLQDGGQ